MRRITVLIPDDALAALVELGRRERRDSRNQAAVLLIQALWKAGVLAQPTDDPNDNRSV